MILALPHLRAFPSLLIILLIALGAALGTSSPLAAQERTLDLETYLRTLREAHAAAERGDRIGLELAAPALTTIDAVTLPGGERVPVDNRWLAEELQRSEPRLPFVAARLGALIDALTPPGPPPPDNALQRLERILARPPFASPEPQPRNPGPVEDFFEQLGEWLSRLFQPIGDSSGLSGAVTGWAVILLGAALVLGVLLHWLRGLWQALRPETTLRPPPATPHIRNAAEARAQAEEHARRGNYREAVRMLALAALLWLDERGFLRYEPHQTNREHLARLRDQSLHERLAAVVEMVDRVWYGGAPIDAAAYAEYVRRVNELHEAAGHAT